MMCKNNYVYGAYADDVIASKLIFQNNEMRAMLVYQTNPARVQLFSCVNTFVPINLHGCWTCECIQS